MTATKLQPKGYDYILNDLREHKEKVDRAIRALEALRDSAIPTAVVLENGAETSHKEADTYSGMYFLDALRDLSQRACSAEDSLPIAQTQRKSSRRNCIDMRAMSKAES
jgi:hypothetical protein